MDEPVWTPARLRAEAEKAACGYNPNNGGIPLEDVILFHLHELVGDDPALRWAADRTAAAVAAEASAGAEAPSWRTLADVQNEPLQDLLVGMIEPAAETLIYGKGGVGKGSTAAWLCVELLKAGVKPLIYDAEQRPGEWRQRIEGLGGDPAAFVYVEPHELPAHLMGNPLWDIVPHLGRIAKAAACKILVVDSILAGMNMGEDGLKSHAGAPYHYTRALQALGIPTLSIGHTSRATPDGDPYGSVSWVNSMRLTWLGTAAEGSGHVVRWRPRKRNQRGHIDAVRLAFSYDDAGRLCGVARENDDIMTRDWLVAALYNNPRTAEELAEDLLDEQGADWTASDLERAKERLRKALGRMRVDGIVTKPKKRNAPWALAA